MACLRIEPNAWTGLGLFAWQLDRQVGFQPRLGDERLRLQRIDMIPVVISVYTVLNAKQICVFARYV